MCKCIVADSSVFILGRRPEGDLITVPGVEAELKDIGSRSRLSIFNTKVESPLSDALNKVLSAAKETGDIFALSKTDLDVLAKAWEYRDRAALASDDYAVQNVALHLGLKVSPVAQPMIKRRLRHVRKCYACGRTFEGEACPDCGTALRKRERRIR